MYIHIYVHTYIHTYVQACIHAYIMLLVLLLPLLLLLLLLILLCIWYFYLGFKKAHGHPKPKSGQCYQQLTCVWGSRLFEGPQFPKKGLQKAPWSPQAKKWPVLSATHILGSRFCEGHQFPKKGFQKAPGCPKPKSGQFYHQLTYWKPLF